MQKVVANLGVFAAYLGGLLLIILGAVGKISRNRKHKQFFDKIILKKLERIAYVKQIISQTNFKLLVE